MKILNTQILLLETYQRDNPVVRRFPMHLPTAGFSEMQDSGLFKQDELWYCMFTTELSFNIYSIRELMGEEIFAKVKNKTATIVLDMPFEPFLDAIDSIYNDIVMRFNIDPQQIVFMSAMYDADQYNKIAAERYQKAPIRIFYFSSLELMLKNSYHGALPKTLELKNYDKKFLNLNRRWRHHRPMLTILLYNKQLLDKGYVSFGPCENNLDWDSVWDGLKVDALDNPEMLSIMDQNISIKNMPPLYLDTDELHTNRAELTDTTNSYYENSYFSVVSETTFYHKHTQRNSRFLTEKTYKAIKLQHPFVIVSLPKSLEALKELGYKTFSPWIDESYDQELNDNKRLVMITAEVERLCNLPEEQLKEFLVAMKEICMYNYTILQSRERFLYERK